MADAPDLDPARAVELLTHANDPIFLLDATATIVWANPAAREFGWEPSDLVGRGGLDQLDRADHERALAAMAVMAEGHRLPSSAPYTVLTPDGEGIECDVSPIILGGDGSEPGLGLHLRPTQDSRVLRRLLERLLAGASSVEVLGDLADLLYHRNRHARVLLRFLDEDGHTVTVGDDALDPRLGGVTAGPSIGPVGANGSSPWRRAERLGEPVGIDTLDDLPDDLAAVARDAGLVAGWVVPVHLGEVPVGTITVWVDEGGFSPQADPYSVQLLAQLTELVLRWRHQTRDLERAATRDPLTGLPNRRALAEFDAEGPRRDLGVLYIDLDHFKPVNDRLGHAAGDQVLRTVATRLLSLVRPTDIVARLGGDEFGIVCPGCSRTELADLAAEVQGQLAEAIGVHHEVVVIGSSIGAALGHDSVGPLLERADRALYDAKEAGRGTVRWAG